MPAIPRLSRHGGRWSTALLLAVLSGLLVLSGRASAQSDPLLSQQWHLLDPGIEPAGANVLSVWPITNGLVPIAENDDFGDSTNSRLEFPSLGVSNFEIQVTSFRPGALGAYTISLGPTPGVYTATGRITNNTVPVPGVTVAFARPTGGGVAPAAVTTDVNGVWSQTGFVNGIFYSATPSKPGRIFVPAALTFRTSDEATALDFEATCPATPIAFGQTLSGTIAATDCRAADDPAVSADRYVFMGSALAPVAISMSSTAFDTFLVLYGPDGTLLATNDDSGGSTNSRIPAESGFFFELPQSGQYIIEATPLAPGLTGAYTINVTASNAGFEVFGFVTSDGTSGIPGVTLSFSRVSGNGPLPGPTTTDSDGFWSRAGFAFGTTYRVRAAKSGSTFSPPFQDFAGDLGDLSFVTSGPGCVATPITFGTPLTRSLDANDCLISGLDTFFDAYTFTASAGTGVQITVTSPNFTPIFDLHAPDGVPIAASQLGAPIPPGGGFLELPLTGSYLIRAAALRTSSFPTGSYTINLTSGVPGLALPAESPARPLADEPTAVFWTPVGNGAADGGGISTGATGVAGPPSIAVDPVNGDIYAAWESGGSDIYVKRWNGSDWVEIGADSASGGGISNNAGASRFPSVAVMQPTLGQPGVPVVAWIDQSSGNWEIYVKAFNPISGQWDPAGDPDAASGGGISQAGPNAIVSAEDARPSLVAERSNLFVAWATNGGAPSTHRAVVSALRPFIGWAPLATAPANANVAAPALEYGAQAAGYAGARLPSIGINRADGNPLAVYVTGNTNTAPASTFADVHVRRWTPNTWAPLGTGAAADTGISNDGPPRGAGYALTSPRVTVGGDGVPYAAWLYSDGSGARRITVRRFSSSANAWQPLGSDVVSSDVFLPPGTGIGPALSLTVGRDNLPIVAWSQGATTGNEVYVRKFSPIAGWHELGPGSASGGGVSANAGFSRFPALAVDTHNNLNTPIVAWLDNSGGLPQIYVRRAVSNADLIVESVSAPSTGAAGQAVDVSAVVRNRGPVAAGAFGVGLFLSTNNTIDPAGDRLLTTQQVSGLAAGAQATVTAHVTLPANVAPGAYFVGAFADIGQVIDEIDEANNGLVGSNGIQIVGPDLVVTALNGPFTATPGQMLAVEVTVKNQAAPPGAAAASRVGVYLRSALRAPSSRSRSCPASRRVFQQPASVLGGGEFLSAVADFEDRRGGATATMPGRAN